MLDLLHGELALLPKHLCHRKFGSKRCEKGKFNVEVIWHAAVHLGHPFLDASYYWIDDGFERHYDHKLNIQRDLDWQEGRLPSGLHFLPMRKF